MKTRNKISQKNCLNSVRYPNKKTLKAIEDVEKGKGLTAHKDMTDLLKKLDFPALISYNPPSVSSGGL